jgi:hypothetical protein
MSLGPHLVRIDSLEQCAATREVATFWPGRAERDSRLDHR